VVDLASAALDLTVDDELIAQSLQLAKASAAERFAAIVIADGHPLLVRGVNP
jgi:hypothetical protein